ncbi:MAG: choice-of-anchor L domain-containing protein, partial [Bacteroidetes bacterium]|nr:choice-of-anchor L domain-containing protein [Bacteroidota bacterium]
NTTTPVAINNVNQNSYWQYYINNDFGATVEYDGFTTLLAATKDNLIPCETYTLKLMIADVSDGAYDSGVFLEENSLVQGTVDVQTNTVNADSVALEGCIKASFTFSIDSVKNTPTVINYGIGGTAINGVDYVFIDSTMTIPAGQTSATIIIDALADGIPEPQEVIWIYYEPFPCAPFDTVYLYIDDADPINFSLFGTDLGCAGDSSGIIDGSITGGFPPYSITLNDQNTFDSLPITGLPADTYLVSIIDIYGCDAEAIVTGGIDTAGLTFLPDGNGNVYTTSINITAFDPSALLTDISMLQSICISMEHSFIGELEIKLIAPDSTEIILKQQPGGSNANFGEPVALGPTDGNNPDTTAGICYEYCFTINPTYGTMVSEVGNYTYTYTDVTGRVLSDKYLPSGSYQSYQPLSGLIGVPLNGDWTIWVMDNNPNDNGYICSWSISLTSDLPDSIVILGEPNEIVINDSITFSICGDSTGIIDITIAGDFPPFTYSWSNGATTEDISGLSAGSYTLTVTDSNGCSNSATFLLQNISSMVLSAAVSDVTCSGLSNGSIDLTVSGGVTPYIFAWDNGANTEDISAVLAGDYTVTVTDSVGCISLNTITVSEPDVLNIVAVNILNEQCGFQNGAIDIAVTGGTTPFSFNWSNGETTEDIDTLPTGSYIVTVTDSNGCSTNDTFSLINEVGNCVVYCFLEVDNILVTDEICGNGSGAIDITPINGTQPYIYSWSNGATTEDISSLNAGTYTVNVKDAVGCEADDTIIVNNNTGSLAITNTVVTNEVCGNGQGQIDNTISGGALPYTYLWSNGQTTEDASGLSFGNYSCTITDANGCSINMNVDVLNDAGTLVQIWGNSIDELCGNGQGSVDITISGGSTPYSYSWTNGATTEDIMSLSAGTYACTITDWNGCQITTPTYTINNDAGTLAILGIIIFNETCSDGAGSINLNITGGTTPYTFAWNTGATSEDINGLSAGTYSCLISDANSCSVNTGDIDIFNSTGTLALDDIFVTDENCSNVQGAINITISGGAPPYSFAWSNGSTSEDLSGLSAGTYSCTITDTNGCTINTEATVNNVPGTLSLDNTVITNEICGNGQGTVDLFISGGTLPITYLWSNGDITEDIFNLSAGSYTCQITDVNGCSINVSANVTNDAGTLSLDNTVVTNEICGNGAGSIDITVSGGSTPYSFNWDNGATTEDLSGLSAGTYSCQVTDNNGCIINVGPITINNSSGGLTIDGIVVTNESCGNAGGAVDLTISGGSGPYTYTWSNGDTTKDISSLVAGIYICLITDINGCSININVDVLNDAGTLSLDNFTVTDEVCGNGAGAIDLTVSGGLPITFTWSSGDTTEDISGLSAGTYSCIIIDSNGCTVNTEPFNVVNNAGTLSLDNVFVNNESCGDGSGYINITVSAGTLPYTFSWNNGSTTEDIFGLNAGTYSCQITDAAGCTINLTANVSNNAGNLVITDSMITNELCSNELGAIDINVGGGFPPYSFSWSNGDTTEDISGLNAGTYSLLVTDTGGCSANHSVTINNLGGDLTISGTSVTNEICGDGTGAIDITVSGGGAPYTYSWSNGATTEDISGLSAGNYTVIVTDTNSCTTDAAITVQNSSVNLVISNVVVIDDNCAAGIGAIDITVTGGITPYTYIWSNGANTQDISGLFAGNYSVIVTDWNGCGTNMSANVLDNAAGYAINNVVVTDEICGD